MAGATELRRRGANIPLGYMPNPANPRSFISSEYGPPLQNTALEEVSAVLMKIDSELIGSLRNFERQLLDLPEDRSTPSQRVEARHDLEDTAGIQSQLVDVINGRHLIHQDYPKDRHLVGYWAKSFNLLCSLLLVLHDNEAGLRDVSETIFRVELLGIELKDRLLEAASQGQLSEDVQSAVRAKWERFDAGVDYYHEKIGTNRECPAWAQVLVQLNNARKKAPAVAYAGARNTRTSRKLEFILWLTFIGTSLIGVPSMALAFKFSSPERGKWRDADFWFLTQVSSFQFCGLLVTGLTLWEGASKWYWAPIAVALLATIAGPALYCFTPAYFGVLANTLAGFVQAFIVLRSAIGERGK